MGNPQNRATSIAVLACLTSLAMACASMTAVDVPLEKWTPELSERPVAQVAGDRSPEMLVLVAFSGGGTRAAAFAYGALQELRDTEVMTEHGPRPLLGEVDMISSVSGGSFTSAYYALHGDRIFDDFEERFLRENIEGDLLLQVFRPISWARLFSATYTRSDIAANYYDEKLFDGATFGDLRRPDAPLIVINSTDLATGNRFAFTTDDFSYICADVDRYPISRAVAASSAVPVLLSPVTLENFAGTCEFEPPAWLSEALADETLTSRKLVGRAIQGYLNRNEHPFLHLVDGGIADNLGLRTFYEAVHIHGGDPLVAFQKMKHSNVRHVLIISIDAHVEKKKEWALERNVPSLADVVQSVSADQIQRYSVDTIELVRHSFERWTHDASTPEHPLSFDFVEVSFEAERDPEVRESLNAIGTNFHLRDKEVDQLISVARKVLRDSKEFQAFLARSGGRSIAPESTAAAASTALVP